MGGSFSAADLRPRDQFGGWKDAVARWFGAEVTARGPVESFASTIETAFVGSLPVTSLASPPVVVSRSERDISRVEMDAFTLGMVLEGSGVISQRGREARFGAGDLILGDSRSSYQIRFDGAYRQLVVTLDRQRFEARLPQVARRTPICVDGRSGPGRVAGAYLDALRDQAGRLGVAQEAIGECTLDLVALALGGEAMRPGPAVDGGERLLLDRIKAFIEAHLGESQVTPDLIASRHGISRRYLYGLFEMEGATVAGYVWQRRLARCREALLDAGAAERSISEIAFQWGFNDASHFCRAFRRAFGTSPRDFRRRANARDD